MSATTVPVQASTERRTHPVRRATVVSAIAGAAAATAFAAVASAAGVPFEVDGEPIPLGGFTMMTVLGAVLGGILLAVVEPLRRTAPPPVPAGHGGAHRPVVRPLADVATRHREQDCPRGRPPARRRRHRPRPRPQRPPLTRHPPTINHKEHNMPQYLMSVWHDDDYDVDFSSPDAQRQVAQVSAVNAELEAAGAWVFGGGLSRGVVGHRRPQQRRRGVDDRRPLRRDEGTDGRVLGHRSRRPRRRPRLGRQGRRRV